MKSKKYFEIESEIVSYKEESSGIVSCVLNANEIAAYFRPGQFITVQIDFKSRPVKILRRPFAISSVNNGNIEFIFNIVGGGTKILYDNIRSNEKLKFMGPLGNGFDTKDSDRNKLMIAGGIGIAPLKSLIQYFSDKKAGMTLIWGNKDSSGFFNTEYYRSNVDKFIRSTDDGSEGFKGTVLDLLKSGRIIKSENLSEFDIYTVGPDAMMSAVSRYLASFDLNCQVSLESPMACGMGVCQGCAVQKKDGQGYYLVCKDGPVFCSDKIIMS